MSVGLKMQAPARSLSPLRSPQALRASRTSSAAPRRTTSRPPAVSPSTNVRAFPTAEPLPFWLRSLSAVQHRSTFVTLFLTAAVLIVYGQIVYAQQLWGQEYRKLESLQRTERQLTATNESLKNQIAEQAERPNTGLVLPSPANTIFLQPAPTRPLHPTPTPPETAAPTSDMPVGY